MAGQYQNGYTGSAAGVVCQFDTSASNSLSMQIVANASGNTFLVEESNDGITWFVVAGYAASNIGVSGETTSIIATTNIIEYPTKARLTRIRCSTFVGGTFTILPFLSQTPAINRAMYLAGGATIGVSTPAQATTVGCTNARIKSAASTNATSVKASAGNLYDLQAANTSAALKFLKLYNKASAPTVGTDVPLVTIPLPANGLPVGFYPALPIFFSAGIAYAITGAVGDTDTTAVAVDDVTGLIQYA